MFVCSPAWHAVAIAMINGEELASLQQGQSQLIQTHWRNALKIDGPQASQQSRICGICCFLLQDEVVNKPPQTLLSFDESFFSGAALSPTHTRSQPTPSSHIMSSWSLGCSEDDHYGQNMGMVFTVEEQCLTHCHIIQWLGGN